MELKDEQMAKEEETTMVSTESEVSDLDQKIIRQVEVFELDSGCRNKYHRMLYLCSTTSATTTFHVTAF